MTRLATPLGSDGRGWEGRETPCWVEKEHLHQAWLGADEKGRQSSKNWGAGRLILL